MSPEVGSTRYILLKDPDWLQGGGRNMAALVPSWPTRLSSSTAHGHVTSQQWYFGWCLRGVQTWCSSDPLKSLYYRLKEESAAPPPTFFLLLFLNESKSLETFRRGLPIRDKSPVRPQIAAPFSGGPPVAGAAVSPLFFPSRSAPLTKEGKKRLKKRQRQEKRSLSNALHRTMNFPRHSNVSAECLSDSLQQILKCDNGPQKWVMLSFCWFHFPDPPYPPWPVYLY